MQKVPSCDVLVHTDASAAATGPYAWGIRRGGIGTVGDGAERTLVRVALVALLVYAVPHTIFHAAHLEGFPPGDALGQTVGTVLHLVLTATSSR